MRPVTVLLLAGAGAASLCASGCFGPMYSPAGPYGAPGYSQYGYPANSYPGMGGGTFQTLTPGQQYIPGGTIDSGASSPTPTYGGGSSIPVPTPQDPNSPYFPNPNENYNLPNSGANASPTSDAPPFSAVSRPAGDSRLSATTEPLPDAGPIIRPAGLSELRPGRDASYDHDGAGYAWVEGVVSFDETDQTWNIVYNLDPTESDRYAGHFTLSESPLAGTFREGEAVRLEGRIDPVQRDRFGKPTYLAERIIRKRA